MGMGYVKLIERQKRSYYYANFAFGAGDANYVELILINFLSHINRLMEAYQEIPEESLI